MLLSYELEIESVTVDDAEWAASRRSRGEGMSLADRLCMALGDRFEADVLTADRTWGTSGRTTQIR